jgi:hypothetical protein
MWIIGVKVALTFMKKSILVFSRRKGDVDGIISGRAFFQLIHERIPTVEITRYRNRFAGRAFKDKT